jgi:type II secretory pathway predicted ATPase ExeA
MYEQFFNFLGLREDPFHVSPDPRFFYTTPSHEAALAELLYGIETRKGFMVLTGEAGTGKTSLLKQILDWLKSRRRSTAYIFHTHVEPIGLLKLILSDFGVPCESRSKSELIRTLHAWLLQRHSAGDLPVLVLDEAQALPMQTLDELRLLLNLETPRGKLVQIILSGQPELEETLRLPELRQLRQRIVFHSRLDLLSPEETAAYISRRLAVAGCPDSLLFPDEVVQGIYASSRGIPRIVNLLCEHALISAYAERQHVVSAEMIQRVAADFDLVDQPIALPDSELRAEYACASRFPLMQESESTHALDRDSLRWLDQIDFDATKNTPAPACKWPLQGIQESTLPQTAPAVTAVPSPEPLVEHHNDPPATRDFEAVRKYWRGHRSFVTKLARNCSDSAQRAWDALTSSLQSAKYRLVGLLNSAKPAVQQAEPAQVTPKASLESQKPVPRPVEVSVQPRSSVMAAHWRTYRSTLSKFSGNCQQAIHRSSQQVNHVFEAANARLAALFGSIKTALTKNLTKQTPRKASAPPPKPVEILLEPNVHHPTALPANWQTPGSRAAARSSAIDSATAHPRRSWHAVVDPVVGYVRTVLHSFVRDCQSLFRAAIPPTPALELGSSAEASHATSSNRRVLAPVVNWFRQPMTVRRIPTHRPASTPAPRAKAQAAGSRNSR